MEKSAPKNFGCSLACTASGVLAGLHLLCSYVFSAGWLREGAVIPAEGAMTVGLLGLAVAFMLLLLICRKRGVPGPVPMGVTLVVSLLGSYYWVTRFPELLRTGTELLNGGTMSMADYEALRSFGYMGLFLMLALLVMTYILLAKTTGLSRKLKEGALS